MKRCKGCKVTEKTIQETGGWIWSDDVCDLCHKYISEICLIEGQKIMKSVFKEPRGCSVLFKTGSGIVICGENRADGNCFLCKRCFKDSKNTESKGWFTQGYGGTS